MSAVGYLVRLVEPEISVSDILYSYNMHVFYPTFAKAVHGAYAVGQKEAEKRGCQMICLLSDKSESACEKNGYSNVLQISTEYESYNVCIFALYSE